MYARVGLGELLITPVYKDLCFKKLTCCKRVVNTIVNNFVDNFSENISQNIWCVLVFYPIFAVAAVEKSSRFSRKTNFLEKSS